MNFLRLVCISFILCGAALASSEGGEHHASVADLLYPAINFIILFSFLFWKIKKPLANLFEKNARDVQELFNVAKEKDKEAQIKFNIYQEKLNNFHVEHERIKKEAIEDAEKFEKSVEQETKELIQKMTEDAAMKAEYEKTSLLRDLNETLVGEIINKAKNTIALNSDYKAKATAKLVSKLQ